MSSSNTVKIEFNNDLRRVTLSTSTFKELENRVREIFYIEGPFTLKYKDFDGDEITLSSDDELTSALVEFAPLKLKVFLSSRATSSYEAPSFSPVKERVYEKPQEQTQKPQEQTQKPQEQTQKPQEQTQKPQEQTQKQQQQQQQPEQPELNFEDLFARSQKLAEVTAKVIQENPEIMKEAEEISKQLSGVIQGIFGGFAQQQQQHQQQQQPFGPFGPFGAFFGNPQCSRPCNTNFNHPFFSPSASPSPSSSSSSNSTPPPPPSFNVPSANFARNSSPFGSNLYPETPSQNDSMSVDDSNKYQEHIKTLNSMGFCDYNENISLLNRFNGDISKVVNYLLSN